MLENEKVNQFDKLIFKILDFLRLTSGSGIIVIGGFWFIYMLISYVVSYPDNAIQQQVHEIYFLQAEIGVVIIALGVLIKEIKSLSNK